MDERLDFESGTTATIRRRKKNEQPFSDSSCTPLWLAELMPFVDLDPASNPRSHIRSAWSYSLEKCLNGLKLPWRGSVFLNHPYSSPMPWMKKLYYELSIGRCTSAIVLAKLDSSPDWWPLLTAPILRASPRIKVFWTPDLWLFKDRIQFDESPELVAERLEKVRLARAAGKKMSEKTSNNFCSAIVHHRFDGEPLKLEKYATLWRRP